MDYLIKVKEKGLNFLYVYFDFIELEIEECYLILFIKEFFDIGR